MQNLASGPLADAAILVAFTTEADWTCDSFNQYDSLEEDCHFGTNHTTPGPLSEAERKEVHNLCENINH